MASVTFWASKPVAKTTGCGKVWAFEFFDHVLNQPFHRRVSVTHATGQHREGRTDRSLASLTSWQVHLAPRSPWQKSESLHE